MIAPLTIDVEINRPLAGGHTHVVHQTILRTTGRIHLASGDGLEWLFERNALDPTRVAGLLVRHASKEIVEYDESDLRTMMGIRGWADVVTFGFDADVLTGLRPTGQTRSVGGIQFTRYAGGGNTEATVRDVWWSPEYSLPSEFVIAEPAGSVRFSIERIRPGADEQMLRGPATRFPEYKSIAIADWLERH